MENSVAGLVLGFPKSSTKRNLLFLEPNLENHLISHSLNASSNHKQIKFPSAPLTKLGPKITEAVKGKLSLGAKFLQTGGVTRVFKRNFSVKEGEKLLKVFQCCLSTTAGPIAGLLFISSDKVAFCSDKSIEISSQTGDLVKIQYKITNISQFLRLKRSTKDPTVSHTGSKSMQNEDLTLTEAVKGKSSLGAKFLQIDGMTEIFQAEFLSDTRSKCVKGFSVLPMNNR